MTNKRIRLPREGLVEPEQRVRSEFVDQTDVEGHSWTNPAPPIDFGPRSPTHGGELTPSDDEDPNPDKLRQ